MPEQDPLAQVDDEDLALRMMGEDESALRTALKVYGPKVKGFLRRQFGDQLDDSERAYAFQKSLIKFWRTRDYLKNQDDVINPALPHEDFAEAIRVAQAEFDLHQPQVVVGSSRGGAVARNIKSGPAKLVLLCPAWKKFGVARTVMPGSTILHSRGADVVPFGDCEELVRIRELPPTALIEFGSDHRLADQEPLEAMLRACVASYAP